MLYLLLEARAKLPIMMQLTEEQVNIIINSIDNEYETLIRTNGMIFEKYNPKDSCWDLIKSLGEQ